MLHQRKSTCSPVRESMPPEVGQSFSKPATRWQESGTPALLLLFSCMGLEFVGARSRFFAPYL